MHKITSVLPLPDYKLLLTFSNNEVRRFDVTPYLDKGIFNELRDKNYFQQVSVCFDSITWKGVQDFSPETLYLRSVFVNTQEEVETLA